MLMSPSGEDEPMDDAPQEAVGNGSSAPHAQQHAADGVLPTWRSTLQDSGTLLVRLVTMIIK